MNKEMSSLMKRFMLLYDAVDLKRGFTKEWAVYETLGVFLEEDLPMDFLRWHAENNHDMEFGSHLVSPSQNLLLFTTNAETAHSLECPVCGMKSLFWALQRSGNRPFHLNLWGLDSEQKLRLFTKDHVVPKSKGGLDVMENYQPMCMRCNGKKGNK